MLVIFDKVDVRVDRANHNVDNYIMGTRLKEFRQQAGLSLAKVAESVGVTPAFISMVENGKCGISFQKVHALVKLYGKTLADVTSTHPLADEKVINLNAASEVAFEPGIKAFGLAKGTDPFKLGGFRLFYEPGAQHIGVVSLDLLKHTYQWAREAKPTQPITSCICEMGAENVKLQAYQLTHNDVNTYHNYKDAKDQQEMIKYLRMLDRPLICTEYMARKFDSRFTNVLPVLKANHVGAINWGFVAGKTNTNFAWGDPQPDKREPELWFHDIYRTDGTPFSQEEVDTIRSLTHDNPAIYK